MAAVSEIEIIDNGPSLKIVMEGNTRLFLKNHIKEITVIKPATVKLDLGAGPLRNLFLSHEEVTTPRTSSPEELRDAINIMLKNELGDIKSSVDSIDSKIFFEPLLVDESNSKTIYKGFAPSGSKTDEPVWAIQKVVNNKDVITYLWADGNKNFDNKWDDRVNLTYA